MSDLALTPDAADARASLDAHLGDITDDADAASHDNQFVTFSVAGEMFAVPMGPVPPMTSRRDPWRSPRRSSSAAIDAGETTAGACDGVSGVVMEPSFTQLQR